ncbi:MAG: hypothetical protein KDD50_04120 [Bdellovibrionales bacterium]|nr:hypothetical protein [Bdellovibrionales bacterium]
MANVSKNKFNFRKFMGVSTSILTMTLILTQFQNCAPASMDNTPISDSSNSSSDQMRVVDDWQQNKLLFVQPQMVVDDGEEDILLYGICDRKSNDTYEWVVTDHNDEKVHLSGTSFCEGGGFKLVVNNLRSLNCDQEFTVLVTDDEGSQDSMTLTKHCRL